MHCQLRALDWLFRRFSHGIVCPFATSSLVLPWGNVCSFAVSLWVLSAKCILLWLSRGLCHGNRSHSQDRRPRPLHSPGRISICRLGPAGQRRTKI